MLKFLKNPKNQLFKVRRVCCQHRTITLAQIWNENQKQFEEEQKRKKQSGKARQQQQQEEQDNEQERFSWKQIFYSSCIVALNGACVYAVYRYIVVSKHH